jgi:exonuclease III
MALLKIGSINCRGLSSDKIKRRDIFLKCRQNYDISFLIDTHSKNETEPYWRSEWGNDIKFSSQSSNSRGVAILFRNTFQYHIEREIKDSDRNFIILSVRINDTLWTLVAVKGPNNDEPQFFTNLQRKIESLGNSSVIIGGDWNVPLNYSMDTLNYMHKNNEKAQKTNSLYDGAA